MNNIDIKYLITAFVDGEISDEAVKNTVLEKINSDSSLRYDYLVQKKMKELVARSRVVPVPEKVKRKIIRKIKPRGVQAEGYNFRTFPSAAWAYGMAAVFIIAAALLLFNRPPAGELTTTASKNMFLEAEQNFAKIASGELKPQIVTSDPEELQKFFKNRGVKYASVIPVFNDLNLVGGVVSEENGEKLSHHVYSDQENHLVYVFQADRSYINDGTVINLPDYIRKSLDKENCYTTSGVKTSSLITVKNNNVLAVVSDLSLNEIEDHFCR